MRVLLIIPYISPVYGGTGQVVRSMAQALGDRGVAVDVVSTNAHDRAKLDVPLHRWIPEAGYRIQYFDGWHRYDQTLSWSLLRWLGRHLEDYDVVHAHTLFAPMLSWLYGQCRRRGIPYIMTPHGMLEPWAIAHRARKKALYLKYLEFPALAKAAAIQVLTPVEAEQVQKLGFSHTCLIPNGLSGSEEAGAGGDPQLIRDRFPATQDKDILLFLSRLDPKKGLDLLAPAFAQLHRAFPQTHLIIAGPDSIGYLPTVQGYFAAAGCSAAVTFAGMLTGDLKRSALAAAAGYVLPSYSEGFSVSVLEAMAAGVPCVITTGCNFPEAAAAQAAYIVPAEVAALTAALLDCWRDRPHAIAMGQQARTLVQRDYTWTAIGDRLVKLYEKIASSR